jgi:hypothetical protein
LLPRTILDFKGQYDRQQLFTFIETELNAVIPNLKAARTNEYGRLDKDGSIAKMYLNAEVYIGTPKYVECMEANVLMSSVVYVLKTN